MPVRISATMVRARLAETNSGYERQQVAEVQTMLSKLGHDVGKIDGKYVSKTAKAIKAFQKEHQLKVDGKLSESLLERLKAAGASTGQQTQ